MQLDDEPDADERSAKKGGFPLWAWFAIGGGLMLLVCGGAGIAGVVYFANKAKNNPSAPPPTYEASELLKEFASDPKGAARSHEFRDVRVRGTVKYTFPSVQLGGSEGTTITCFPRRASDFEKLVKGQTVTVSGRVSLGNEGGVWLKDAELVK